MDRDAKSRKAIYGLGVYFEKTPTIKSWVESSV